MGGKRIDFSQGSADVAGTVFGVRELIYLCVLLLLAFLYRFDFLQAGAFSIDADEAIVGLMAKHIVEGSDIPVFYYGQHYMGSFESLLTALVFKLFGISNPALKAVPLFFSLLYVILIYLFAYEVGGRVAARLAALFAALPPLTLVVWSAKARGGFIEIVVIGTCAFYLAILWLKERNPDLVRTTVIAAVLGFGWWVNNQIIYFMLPIGAALFFRLIGSGAKVFIAHLLAGLAAFIFGSAPFWVHNYYNDFASFGLFQSAGAGVLKHIQGLFTVALPILLGAKRYWHYDDLYPGSTMLLLSLYGALLAVVLYGSRAPAAKLQPPVWQRPNLLLLLFLLGIAAVFTTSSFGYLVQAPRYLLPAYTGIFVLAAAALASLWQRVPKFCAGVVVLIVASNLASSYWGGRAVPGEPFVFKGERVSKDHSELLEWLLRKEVKFIRTNYWIGYRVAFETGERVRFVLFQTPDQERIPEYSEAASLHPQEEMPLVLVPSQADLVRLAFTYLGYEFEEELLSNYVVLYNVRPVQENLIPALDLSVRTSAGDNDAISYRAVDRDIGTRWGSGRPQAGGMTFTVDFSEGVVLRGLKYELGEWSHDYPRKLNIYLVDSEGGFEQIVDPVRYEAIRYCGEEASVFKIRFSPRRIRQIVLSIEGEHELFDWSIAELSFFY